MIEWLNEWSNKWMLDLMPKKKKKDKMIVYLIDWDRDYFHQKKRQHSQHWIGSTKFPRYALFCACLWNTGTANCLSEAVAATEWSEWEEKPYRFVKREERIFLSRTGQIDEFCDAIQETLC